MADDFTISEPVTVTNGGFTVNGNDSITVTTSGSISASTGLSSTGGTNVLTNNGTITTPDSAGSNGIFAADSNSTIINTGIITSGGDGIESYHSATVTNSGSITITGTGADARGIHVLTNGRVTNSGSISLTGSTGSAGIVVDNGSTVTNTGRVTTVGTGVEGITVSGAPDAITVTNSGLVSAAQASAIMMGTNGTLNLQAPSFIAGQIDLGTNTIVNIETGASHSVFWDLSTGTMNGGVPNFSGPLPVFYNSGSRQVATFDPTGLAGSVHQLGEMAGLFANLGDVRASGFDDVQVSTHGAAPEDARYSQSAASRQFWVSGLGGYARYDATNVTLEHTSTLAGAAAGYSLPAFGNWAFGVMGGYLNTKIEAESRFADSQDVRSDILFAGLKGAAAFGGLHTGMGAVLGYGWHDGKRTINSNLSSGGLATANYSNKSILFSADVSAGYDLAMAHGWVVTPSIGGNYAVQQFDGYTETGNSGANATVGSHSASVVQANAEIAVSREIAELDLSMRLGYLTRQSVGDENVSVTLLAQSSSVGFGDTDLDAGYLGAAVGVDLGGSRSLNFDGTVFHGSETTGFQGGFRFTQAF